MTKILKNPWFLLIVILVIASFLRLYQITELPPGFYPDEAMYANNGVEAWETGQFKVFYPENNGREGLWSNIIGFFIIKFGHEPWVSRAVAAIFGILTVLGVYFLTKELFNKKIALLSTFLIATSFWHINFSRIGFRAIMAPFFLTWSIYFLLLVFKQLIFKEKSTFEKSEILNPRLRRARLPDGQGFGGQAKSETNSKVSNSKFKTFISNFGFRASCLAILAGLLYGLGLHTYIAYRATPLLILIILLIYWLKNKEKSIRKKILLSVFCFLLTALIAAAPLGLYFLQNPQDFFGRTGQISIFDSPTPIKDLGINIVKTAGMFNFYGDGNWRHNIAEKPLLFWPAGILFLLGIFMGIKTIIKKPQKLGFIVLFSWLLITALPIVMSNEGLPHALRAILLIPPVFILAGIGGVYLYKFIKSQILTTSDVVIFNIFVFLFLSLLVFQAYVTYFVLWGKNPNTADAFAANYVALSRQLNALPKELPKYVVVRASGVMVRGLPMPAQTVMYITDTFTLEKQKEKNIFYVLPEQQNQIPPDSYTVILE